MVELYGVTAVLHRPVGGTAVLREQIRHLINASTEARTTIQVLPFSLGAHPGLIGPFLLLGFPQPTDMDIVYLETIAGNLYVEEKDEVRRYSTAFDYLRAEALNPRDSQAMLNAVLNRLD